MTNISKALNLTSSSTYNIIGGYLAVVVILGTVLNLFVFSVLFSNRSKVSYSGVIMASLACCNLLGPAASYPFAIVANLKRGWHLGGHLCTWYGFNGSLVGFCAIYHLMLLSVERYISMVHPLTRERIISKTSLTLALVIAWMVSFIVALMPVVGWSAYEPEGVGTSCGPRWTSSAVSDLTYNLFMFTSGYLLPMSVICFCHLRFLKEISKMADRIQSETSRKLERQMAIVVFIMILAYNVAWFPYACTSMLSMFVPGRILSPLAESLPAFFAKSSVVHDPIIYALLNKEFRTMISRKSRKVGDVSDPSCS